MITLESFSNITNLKFSDDSGQRIDFLADIEGVGKGVPFTASNADPEPYGHDLYAAALSGTYGTITPYNATPATPEQLQTSARRVRDSFINNTDKLTIVDYSIDDQLLTSEQRQELFAIRAAFKSWPQLPGWPGVKLPSVPGWIAAELLSNGYKLPVWNISLPTE